MQASFSGTVREDGATSLSYPNPGRPVFTCPATPSRNPSARLVRRNCIITDIRLSIAGESEAQFDAITALLASSEFGGVRGT